MEVVASWSAVLGLLLVVMALSDSVLTRLPLSTSMFYLLAGVLVSPLAIGLSDLRPTGHVVLIEHLAEIVVLLSLFTSGLKISVGLTDGRWLLPVRLAVVSMVLTVAGVAAAGVWLVGLPIGAAVLLGAILAPTDPVLAADVQVAQPRDRDRLRFALTGEAGLNDGTAFPFVMLGLGLLGLYEIGPHGWHWFAFDLVWATLAGICVGGLLGTAVGALVLYLRRTHKEAVGLDNFLALGLIALAYGGALIAHGYGFLSVFAAGVALRRVERRASSDARASDPAVAPDVSEEPVVSGGSAASSDDPDAARERRFATDASRAPAYMAHAMLSFNEQIERIGEVAAVMTIGMMLWAVEWERVHWGLVALLLLLIRPVAVAIGLAGTRTSRSQRALVAWFGIRGVGSLYYLMYAIHQGIDPRQADTLIALTLAVLVTSITLHGLSVTPLMGLYERAKRERPQGAADSQ